MEDEWKHWSWRSEGDELMNGAVFIASGDQTKGKKKGLSRYDMISFKPGTYVRRLVRLSGTIECTPGKPC